MFLMAATLRPETMYGQTNCWLLPDGEYGAYRGTGGSVFVMAPRAARNLAWQNGLPVDERNTPQLLATARGRELMGTPLSVRARCTPRQEGSAREGVRQILA